MLRFAIVAAVLLAAALLIWDIPTVLIGAGWFVLASAAFVVKVLVVIFLYQSVREMWST